MANNINNIIILVQVGDLFNNTVQSAQKLNKNLKFRSGRKPAYRPGQRIKLFSKLEKSSNMKKTQGEDIRRSLRDKRYKNVISL